MPSLAQFEHYQDNYLANPGDKEVTRLREFVDALRDAVTDLQRWTVLKQISNFQKDHTVSAPIAVILDKIIESEGDSDELEIILHDESYHLLITSAEAVEYARDADQERRYEASNTAYYYSVGR